jgi:flagellar export protein FliJ
MTKAFEFRLEKLLELRRLKGDAAQREFAAAQKAVVERNRMILALMNQADEARVELRALQQRAIDVGRLRNAGEFLDSLERLLRREQIELQELMKMEMVKRRLLTEARKAVRVLERFRERKLLLHGRELDLEERRFLDEVGQSLAKGA